MTIDIHGFVGDILPIALHFSAESQNFSPESQETHSIQDTENQKTARTYSMHTKGLSENTQGCLKNSRRLSEKQPTAVQKTTDGCSENNRRLFRKHPTAVLRTLRTVLRTALKVPLIYTECMRNNEEKPSDSPWLSRACACIIYIMCRKGLPTDPEAGGQQGRQ